MFYSSLANHVLLAAKGVNQSQEEPELLSDEDENRKITAFEALKKLMKRKISQKSTEATIWTWSLMSQLKMWSIRSLKIKNKVMLEVS